MFKVLFFFKGGKKKVPSSVLKGKMKGNESYNGTY